MSKDLTGQSQFFKNVYVAWFMQVFVMVAGFIVPRQIDINLGAASLGIWDFGWATARYLAMTNMGMAGALTRYSGLYRAENNFEKLNKAYIAVFIWQTLVALIALAASFALALNIESLVDLSAHELIEAKWVMILLGGSIAVSMWTSSMRGLLAGYHRWDIQHTLNGLHDFFIAIAILILLSFFDVGLVHLAAVVLIAAILLSLFRYYYVRKICVEVKLNLGSWSFKEAKKMLVFGGKLTLSDLPQLILFQSIAIIIAAASGPVILAVFNRGVALVRICERLIRRTAETYTPIVSSMIGLDKKDRAKEFLIESTCLSMALTLPMIMGLVFLGDFVLELWMGADYRDWSMLTVMALGSLLPIAFRGPVCVLKGLNAIGRLSMAMLLATLFSLSVSAVIVNTFYQWNTFTAAAVLSVSWTFGSALVVPIYIYLRYSISIFKFLCEGVLYPVIACLPLAGFLFLARVELYANNWASAALACLFGGIVTLTIYVWWVFPDHISSKITGIFNYLLRKSFRAPDVE